MMNDQSLTDAMGAASVAAEQAERYKSETYSVVLLVGLLRGTPRLGDGVLTPAAISDRDSRSASDKPYSPAEFFGTKVLRSEIDKVVVAAAFLENFQSLENYSIDEIRNCLVAAKIGLPKNLSLAIFKAVKRGWLMEVPTAGAPTKSWALTQSGVRYVAESNCTTI
jgi:hypothetical protein